MTARRKRKPPKERKPVDEKETAGLMRLLWPRKPVGGKVALQAYARRSIAA
jgi:hypothetical protein